ncbi:MAG: FAD-dependent oxidoreductase [Candidatus Thorarchaeota archaeon]
MKPIVIGAGWFGCHIAKHLQCEIIEKNDNIFQGTSGHNQNRLHLGFHYPRSYQTRICAKEGYRKFLDTYGYLCETIKDNIYAIANKESFMDFETYLCVLDGSGLDYEIVNPEHYGLTNVTGAIKCKEMLIRNDLAEKYFTKELGDLLTTNKEISKDDMSRDRVYINCTSQMFCHNEQWDMSYEPCIMFNYEAKTKHPAVTIMDGPLCTIYPKKDNIYTLYSVNHSPLGEKDHPSVARMISNQYDLEEKQKEFEEQVVNYIPEFHKHFKHCGYELSMRVSITDNTDKRVPEVCRVDNVIHVLPSKIDNIFHAVKEVEKLL